MRAIETKYLGPSNFRGSRIKAADKGESFDKRDRSLTLSWDDALDSDENHKRAAVALAKKLGWKGTLYGGSLGWSMIWVFHANYLIVEV